VNVPNPDVIIQLHITGNYITLSLNSSGEPLFKRGYRTEVREAPLNEVLAAGLILLSEWDCNSPFVDPMCGSGTLPIEAALIANQTPPGIFREDYGFKRWNNYDEEIFNKIISDWKTIKRKDLKIYGFDKAPSAIRSARNNSARARLAGAIDWQIKSLEELENFQSPGIIITNPPYGVRLDETNLNELYQLLGSTFKHKFVNYNAWIISSNSEAFNHIGLKTSNRIKLMNGPLECFFNKYELFDGSRKIKN
jgi:putative N6-adenine-specific DNA methylase